VEWEGLLRKLVHFRLNPLHSPPIILFYPNKPKWKFCLVMSFPRCLYLFQYYLLNCMMLACINIWIRWDGDGQMNGKIWWKPTSSSNNRELWKYLYIMGVYLVLASCLFFFCLHHHLFWPSDGKDPNASLGFGKAWSVFHVTSIISVHQQCRRLLPASIW